MRQLKHHEQKLLKKVDFLQWKSDDNQREAKVMRRYHIQKREDYQAYNRICGSIRALLHRLSQLPPQDPFRTKQEGLILAKLYDMGLVDESQKIDDLSSKVTVSAFCRRRLPVVMSRIKMSETVRMAAQYVEQGHVRVGPDTITDPAFLVTRNMQDFVTWVDGSKLKRTIATYNDELDDYDLMN